MMYLSRTTMLIQMGVRCHLMWLLVSTILRSISKSKWMMFAKKIQEADDTRSKSLQAIAEEMVVSRKHSGAPVVQYVRAILKQYKLLRVNLELSLKEMKDLYSQISSIRPLEEGEFPCKLNKVLFSFHSAREQLDDQLSTLISSHSVRQEVKSSFRRKAKLVLLDWFHAHQSNPYPSPKLKARWCQETGLTLEQVKQQTSNDDTKKMTR
jgi:hypothetical protein